MLYCAWVREGFKDSSLSLQLITSTIGYFTTRMSQHEYYREHMSITKLLSTQSGLYGSKTHSIGSQSSLHWYSSTLALYVGVWCCLSCMYTLYGYSCTTGSTLAWMCSLAKIYPDFGGYCVRHSHWLSGCNTWQSASSYKVRSGKPLAVWCTQ